MKKVFWNASKQLFVDESGATFTKQEVFDRKYKVVNATELIESAPKATKADLVEAFRGLGLNRHQARLAAGFHAAEEGVKSAKQKLYEAARALGMSDEQAKAFSE